MVSYLTNSIVDQILQELYATHKTLVNKMVFKFMYTCALSGQKSILRIPSSPSQTRQMSHLKRRDGSCEDGTGWRFNRHRDSLDITEEELGTSIVSEGTL